MLERIVVIRAGRPDVNVVPFFLHSLVNAFDVSAERDGDLNLPTHGSCTGLPVHSWRVVGEGDRLQNTGMGRECIVSKVGRSGIFGGFIMLCEASDLGASIASFKASRNDL